MAKVLSSEVLAQIAAGDISATLAFTINSVDNSSYLLDWSVSYDKSFGSASGNFTLVNNDSRFSTGGAAEIKIGDIISLTGTFKNDSTAFPIFYGVVNQRTVSKQSTSKTFTITCLDYISITQNWDVDYHAEGTKVRVTNETLTPNYLDSPNAMLSQIFDFANNSIVSDPAPVILIEDNSDFEDPQYDGFDLFYEVGQLQLSFPINTLDNYSVIAREYYYYTHGIYAEDILEDLLTHQDEYGNYLFGETSEAAVIANHLTTTYQTEEGTGIADSLTPNYTTSTITIEAQLADDYYEDVVSGYDNTVVTLTDTSGFPDSGTASINGDEFTYTGVGSGNTLTGVVGLSDHKTGDYCEYETTYAVGQVWYLKYTNLTTTLTSSDFTLPSGVTIDYIDKRYGRIMLDAGISLASEITCDSDYTFKTLQATGVELNQFICRQREIENVYKAIEKLRKYLAPNYIIRTQGDSKIWATYLSQKRTADYNLSLVTSVNYLEDEDLYTRVIFYGKNNNPHNVMFGEDVRFLTTGEEYVGYAEQTELVYLGEEGTQYIFGTALGSVGHILIDSGAQVPVVWINNVPINNEMHEYSYYDIFKAEEKEEIFYDAIKHKNWLGQTYIAGYKESRRYSYTIKLKHRNIWPSEPVIFYDENGIEVLRLEANNTSFNYMAGTYSSGGHGGRVSSLLSIATASYSVFYSSDDLEIDYENIQFRISKSLFTAPQESLVTATFDYLTSMTAIDSLAYVIDGRFDTQLQTEFYSLPPSDYNYAIIKLGDEAKTIQVLDITAGFYRPEPRAKFDIDMTLSLEYSLDKISYYSLANSADHFTLSGGESKTFDEQDMGDSLQAKYIKIKIEDLKKVEYGTGFYPIALTEIAVYDDIILKGEAKLTPTTETNEAVTAASTSITVLDTHGFTDPDDLDSGEVATAYLIDSDGVSYSFTYTGLESGLTFTGCDVESGTDVASGTQVSKDIQTATLLYDTDYLLPSLKDRLYKKMEVSDELLYSQTKLDALAKAYLEEYYKNHSTITAKIMFAPYLQVGQTIAVTDTYNGINDNYFITSISNNNNDYSVTMARYREDS